MPFRRGSKTNPPPHARKYAPSKTPIREPSTDPEEETAAMVPDSKDGGPARKPARSEPRNKEESEDEKDNKETAEVVPRNKQRKRSAVIPSDPYSGTVWYWEEVLRKLELADPNSYTHLIAYYEKMNTENPKTAESENRICHKGFTHLHRLQCGHYVYTLVASYCGSTCLNDNFRKIRKPLHCQLCFRWSYVKAQGKAPLRWHSLLLHQFVDEEGERAELEKLTTREIKPVYVDPANRILLSSSNATIALIRSLERVGEKQGFASIPSLCRDLEYPEKVEKEARDIFRFTLEHFNRFLVVDKRVLVVASIQLSCLHSKVERDTIELPAACGVEQHEVDDVLCRIDDGREEQEVRDIIEDLINDAPTKLLGESGKRLLSRILEPVQREWRRLPRLSYPARADRFRNMSAVVAILIAQSLRNCGIGSVSREDVFDVLRVKDAQRLHPEVLRVGRILSTRRLAKAALTRDTKEERMQRRNRRTDTKEESMERKHEAQLKIAMENSLIDKGGVVGKDSHLPEPLKPIKMRRNKEYGLDG